MPEATHPAESLRFGVFELDLRAGELRKRGLKVRLQVKPQQVLALLLENPGEVVTREELRQRLWGPDTFVDFDHSLGTAINKLREALDDSAEHPRYIETLPRHGYRFIAAVDSGAEVHAPGESGPLAQRSERRRWLAVVAVAAFAATAALGTIFALNVAGLRDRLLSTARADHGAPFPKIESIAVLPLENLSGDPEQEYFADGMTEELITDLGKISSLRVISRTSVMRYKGTRKTLPEIGRELNVDAVVEGTVQRSGNRVRVTANLVHAPTDRHLWAEAYERDLRDVLALRNEVARAIASEIRVKLTPKDQTRLATTRLVDPEAYEAYLRGRFEWDRLSAEGFKKALAYFQQAIAKDPSYAPAYAGLADCYFKLGDWGVSPRTEVIPKSKAAALKAIALDNTLGEPHASLAVVVLTADWDWAAAESEFRRSLALSPNYPLAHAWYSVYLLTVNKPDEAVAKARKAQALDPGGHITNLNLACNYFFAHQYDQSIAQHRKTLILFPDSGAVHWWQAVAYEQKGMYQEAVTHYLKDKALAGAKPETLAGLQQAYAKSGMKGFWQKELELKMAAPKAEAGSAFELATIFARLGDKDRAFERLESAFQERDAAMILIRIDPRWTNLRSDPRFQDLVRRMNFPP